MSNVIDLLKYVQNQRDTLGRLAYTTRNPKVISRYIEKCTICKRMEIYQSYIQNVSYEYYLRGIFNDFPQAMGE